MPKQTQWGIYAWVHVPTNRMYVGQTGPTVGFRLRRWQHLSELRKSVNNCRYLQNAWNKHGESEFEWTILEDMTGGDTEQLTPREQFWMDSTDSAFNIRPAVDPMVGQVPWNKGIPASDETRRKMSEVRKGIVKSTEWRENLSEALQGHAVTDEARLKMSESHRGKTLPPEQRAKISASLMGNKRTLGHKQSPETIAKKSASLRAFHASR